MLRYVLSFQKIAIKFFSDNHGHNIWNISRIYVIIVKTTSNWKLICSSHNMATSASALDIGLGTLDLSIWGSVWPTHLICALIVPPIICNVGIKGIFGIDIISGVMQFFERAMIPYFTLFYAKVPIYYVQDCLKENIIHISHKLMGPKKKSVLFLTRKQHFVTFIQIKVRKCYVIVRNVLKVPCLS